MAHDKVFFTVMFQFSTRVFTIQYLVAYMQHHFFVFCSVTYCDNFTLQWLFFCCIRNDDTTDCFFFCRSRKNQYSVC